MWDNESVSSLRAIVREDDFVLAVGASRNVDVGRFEAEVLLAIDKLMLRYKRVVLVPVVSEFCRTELNGMMLDCGVNLSAGTFDVLGVRLKMWRHRLDREHVRFWVALLTPDKIDWSYTQEMFGMADGVLLMMTADSKGARAHAEYARKKGRKLRIVEVA